NEPPNTPTIDGPTSGKAGTSYPYTFTSTDPDGDQVSYYIKWDDGSITDWTAFQASGPPGYSESHKWDEQGTYTIEAKAKDTYGVESDWATLEVTMPRNRAITSPFLNFLQNHPNLFPILRLLLQRLGLQ
ncbi:MAG: PKD domain-containing protein, partial [Thermoplasmatales archaeon]|nr:PKD domain-containing protein [Thermoplasmatales archaeon]